MKADYHSQKPKKLSQYRALRDSKQLVVDSFKRAGCLVCPEDAYECLDFHHVEPGEKEANVSAMVMNKVKIETIIEEIEKCILVCSNCHRKIHAGTILLIVS